MQINAKKKILRKEVKLFFFVFFFFFCSSLFSPVSSPPSCLSLAQSCLIAWGSAASQTLTLSSVTDTVVFVSEGQGASPLNGQFVGLAGVQQFFALRGQTEQFEVFEPKNYLCLSDPNVVVVMGRAVGSVAGYPRAEWHFTFIFALDPAVGKFRSLEAQWRVAYWDAQNVFGGRALAPGAPAPGVAPVAATQPQAAPVKDGKEKDKKKEKKDDKKEKKEEKKEKDEKDEKKEKKEKKK